MSDRFSYNYFDLYNYNYKYKFTFNLMEVKTLVQIYASQILDDLDK